MSDRSEGVAFAFLRRALHKAILGEGGHLVEGTRWKVEPRDYQFEESFLFSRSFETLPTKIATQAYGALVHTFAENLQRVVMVGEMPLQLMFYTALIERSVCMSRFDCGIAPDDASKDQEKSCKEAFAKRFDAYANNEEWATKTAFQYGSHNLRTLLSPGHPGRAAIEAVLGAMITSAYSAFETLAADLWVATVDTHFALAANVLGDKHLPGNVVAGYGGDISKVGGRVLRDTKKVTFDSLSGIQEAYRQAFKRQIDAVFDQQLRHTEKVRHLIAHRAGLIDQKFKSDMSGFQEYERQAVGSRILLTGPFTRDRINACVKCGVDLVHAVDEWAIAHQG